MDLSGRDLSFALFENVDCSNVNFEGADLSDATIHRSSFKRANFSNVNFTGARFEECDATYAKFAGADLANFSAQYSSFDFADFTKTDFNGVDLTHGNISLAGANLRGVDFGGMDLAGAMFSEANLTNANFEGANLQDVTFVDANLTNVNFANADFTDVTPDSFDNANIKNARFQGAIIDLEQLEYVMDSSIVYTIVTDEELDRIHDLGLSAADVTFDSLRSLLSSLASDDNVVPIAFSTSKSRKGKVKPENVWMWNGKIWAPITNVWVEGSWEIDDTINGDKPTPLIWGLTT